MFNFKKIILICAIFSLASFNTVTSYDRFAKVVIIGEYGSGKTTLYNLLTDNIESPKHTEQISGSNITNAYKIKGSFWKSNRGIMRWFSAGKYVEKEQLVAACLFDTSGEEEHVESISQFCKNAHIVIVTLDAKRLVDRFINNRSSFIFDNFEKLIYNISHNCKLFVVLTKSKDARDKYGYDKCWQILNLDNLKKFINNKLRKSQINKIYDFDTYYYESRSYKSDIQNIIKDCIKDYGVGNLPESDFGFSAKIGEKYAGKETVYYEDPFFFGLFSTTKSYQKDVYVPALNWH